MNYVQNETPDRYYFTMLPNFVDDLGLDPYAFRLYVHLRRVAGDEGACWQSTTTLAEACKMSRGKVSSSKQELVKAGLIRVRDARKPDGQTYHHITLLDVWNRNAEALESIKQGGCSQGEQGCSPHEQGCSQGERKNNPLTITHEEENNAANAAPPPLELVQPSFIPEGAPPSLKPETPAARVAFARLKANARAKNPRARGPTRFGSLEQKREWERTEREAGHQRTIELIEAGLRKGITNTAGLVGFVVGSWRNNGGVRPPPRAVTNEPAAMAAVRAYAESRGVL